MGVISEATADLLEAKLRKLDEEAFLLLCRNQSNCRKLPRKQIKAQLANGTTMLKLKEAKKPLIYEQGPPTSGP